MACRPPPPPGVTENWAENWTTSINVHYSLGSDGLWYGSGGSVTQTGQGGGTTDYSDGGSDGQTSWSVTQADHVAFNAQLTNTLLAGFVYGDADGWQLTGSSHITANGSGSGGGSTSSSSTGK